MWPRLTLSSSFRGALVARMVARVPRVLVSLAGCVLIALGVRGLVTGPEEAPSVVPSRVSPAAADLSRMAVAEAFARVYLGSSPEQRGRRAAALRALLADGLDDEVGVLPPRAGSARRSLSTAIVAEAERPGGSRLITVAAETSDGTVYLAVPVAPDPSGAFVVIARPAMVGAPRGAPGPPLPTPESVADQALAAVARRSLANYLAGDRANLLADLAPGAVVSLPEPMRAIRVGDVTWVDRARGLVAVQVAASLRGGARAELRYEIGLVSQGERWLVTGIGTP